MASPHLQQLRKIGSVLAKPKYLAVAITAWLITLGLLLWLFSFDTLLYVLTLQNYEASQKVSFFLSPFINSFTFFFRDPVTATRMIFSVLAGISFALFLYARNSQPTGPSQRVKSFSGLGIALLGSGCVACGTSLISPVLIGAGAGTTAVIGAAVGTIGYIIGIVLIVFAIKGLLKRITVL